LGRQAFAPSSDRHRQVARDSSWIESIGGWPTIREVPPGDMPPLHGHHTHDEGFLVLSGEVSLFLGGRELALRSGEFVLAPRGVPHTYRVGDAPARWLNVSMPSGFEQFVEDAAALDEQTPEALAAAAAERGIEILGPPGTMP
jgi:mannose-6-phosphate isomerase-like protein (cupin superfamily)